MQLSGLSHESLAQLVTIGIYITTYSRQLMFKRAETSSSSCMVHNYIQYILNHLSPTLSQLQLQFTYCILDCCASPTSKEFLSPTTIQVEFSYSSYIFKAKLDGQDVWLCGQSLVDVYLLSSIPFYTDALQRTERPSFRRDSRWVS